MRLLFFKFEERFILHLGAINIFSYEQNSRKGGRGGQKAKKNIGFWSYLSQEK